MSELPAKVNAQDINIIMIGDTSVGKTTMISRYLSEIFIEDHTSTIGISVQEKQINILNNTQPVLLKIWDTAGQERYGSFAHQYYRSADGIFVVFDLSEKKTFNKTEHFLNQVNEHGRENVSIILVGNKNDLVREVSKEEAQKIADANKIIYMETSAKTGENIDEAFRTLAEISFKKINGIRKPHSVPIGGERQNDSKKGCNC